MSRVSVTRPRLQQEPFRARLKTVHTISPVAGAFVSSQWRKTVCACEQRSSLPTSPASPPTTHHPTPAFFTCVKPWWFRNPYIVVVCGQLLVALTLTIFVPSRLSCGSPRLVALGIFGALTKLKSAANDLPFTSQAALGLFGQCNAQASKVAYSPPHPSIRTKSCVVCTSLLLV